MGLMSRSLTSLRSPSCNIMSAFHGWSEFAVFSASFGTSRFYPSLLLSVNIALRGFLERRVAILLFYFVIQIGGKKSCRAYIHTYACGVWFCAVIEIPYYFGNMLGGER